MKTFSEYVINQEDCSNFEASNGKKTNLFLQSVIRRYSKKMKVNKQLLVELSRTNTSEMITAVVIKGMFQRGHISLVKSGDVYGISMTRLGVKEMKVAIEDDPILSTALKRMEDESIRREVC